jgi:hypothetical protein
MNVGVFYLVVMINMLVSSANMFMNSDLYRHARLSNR